MKLILLLLLIPLVGKSETFPGTELLSYFSANCRTQGEWTRTALADSISLMETVKSLAQDPDCKGAVGAVSQLETLVNQLKNSQNLNAYQIQIADIDAKEQELMLQLSQSTDPAMIEAINASLRDLQVTRAGLVGSDRAQSQMIGPDKAQMLVGVVQSTNAVFSQISGNQKCLAKNAAMIRNATQIVASVGATVAVVNPALGLGLAAGSAFLGATIEGVRDGVNSRRIRQLADDTTAFEGYKCALETLSERWCQMRDAESFLAFKASQRQREIENGSLALAVRMNDRDIPVLIDWLNRVRSGVAPTTSADADRQALVFIRRAALDSAEAKGSGIIEESRKIFEGYQDLNERWTYLVNLVGRMPTDGVISDVINMSYLPFFLVGLPDDDSIRDENGNYLSLSSWKRPPTFNPTLDVVKGKYAELTLKARVRLNQELNQVLQPDPLQTLTSAFERMGNAHKISPVEGMKNLITFLNQHPPKDPSFYKIHHSTLTKLSEIYRIIQEAIIIPAPIGSTAFETTREPLDEIYHLAQLQYGTVVLSSRLEMLIRTALLDFLENSSQEDQVLVAQLLAADRITDTITKISGTDNLALIRADIKRAQPITISNLDSFIEVFDKNIARILKRLKSEEAAARGTIASTKRYARTELCFLLLSVPSLSKRIDVSLCEGLKFDATLPGGPETEVLSRATFEKDLNDRACQYREYFRNSKIFETWGIKQK